MLSVGDKATIVSPRLTPQYLNGAIIEITGEGAGAWGGHFAETRYRTFDATIVSMFGKPPTRARYDVGTVLIDVDERLLQPVQPPA